MAYEKILVAYDRSEHAKSALDAALEMLEYGLARSILVLSVTEVYRGADPMLESAANMAGVDVYTLSQVEHDEIVEEVTSLAQGFEDFIEVVVRIGTPKDEILRAADSYKCGLIVMGSRGLGAIRSVLGSVSYAVLREAEVPVLVVK